MERVWPRPVREGSQDGTVSITASRAGRRREPDPVITDQRRVLEPGAPPRWEGGSAVAATSSVLSVTWAWTPGPVGTQNVPDVPRAPRTGGHGHLGRLGPGTLCLTRDLTSTLGARLKGDMDRSCHIQQGRGQGAAGRHRGLQGAALGTRVRSPCPRPCLSRSMLPGSRGSGRSVGSAAWGQRGRPRLAHGCRLCQNSSCSVGTQPHSLWGALPPFLNVSPSVPL